MFSPHFCFLFFAAQSASTIEPRTVLFRNIWHCMMVEQKKLLKLNSLLCFFFIFCFSIFAQSVIKKHVPKLRKLSTRRWLSPIASVLTLKTTNLRHKAPNWIKSIHYYVCDQTIGDTTDTVDFCILQATDPFLSRFNHSPVEQWRKCDLQKKKQ